MKKIIIVLEYDDGEFWGWTSSKNNFTLATYATTPDGITANIKDLLQDWIIHEGQERSDWKNANIEDFQFKYQYCMTDSLHTLDDLKIADIAKRTGINNSLMKQYADGLAYVSERRMKKIETAIKELGIASFN
ncbi:hypothetical protein [Emticicia agri]|uniref:Uncharacterized protein n=1 Tax=Emticicia agri TaxID=2492393 RepID=A0A4Q5LNV9_9BACT|nr:hypothetical protein [Emticicia agri]RYU91057.1 hypothetical protein EWM59_27045 [Emticicia agri]